MKSIVMYRQGDRRTMLSDDEFCLLIHVAVLNCKTTFTSATGYAVIL